MHAHSPPSRLAFPTALWHELRLIFVGLCGSARADLTADNWEESTNSKTLFIKFYAPWCGHCKAMAPAWSQATEKYSDSDSILVDKVDCTNDANKDLCSMAGVKGFPTLKYGSAADLQTYEGGRDADSIIEFAST